MNIEFETDLAERIPSLFTQRHKHIIYGLIRWLQPTVCVEIGSFAGYMTAVMAKALKDNRNGELHAIDNFSLGTSAATLHNNLTSLGLCGNVYVHDTANSSRPLFAKIDLAFIDANHGYEGVKNDFEYCLRAGCEVFIFHDAYSWWGVRQFLAELSTNPDFNYIYGNFDEGLAIFKKTEHIPPIQYTKEQYPEGYVK